ncbi:hypothetical protein Aduo_017426 [Ancylostoma duodenale]
MAVFCCERKVRLRERSPLHYNPDDPSTYPIEEKKKKKKEKKSKKSSKKDSPSLSSRKSGQSPSVGTTAKKDAEEASGLGLPKPVVSTAPSGLIIFSIEDSPMRAPNDLETVDMMQSAWGEVQEQRQTCEEK